MQYARESNHELARLAAKGEVYELLEPVRLRADVGKAVYVAYEWLLMEAGPSGGKLVTTHAMLAAQLGGKDPRAARKWYEELITLGLIELISNNAGRLELWVYTPDQAAAPRVRRPDPQRELALEAAASESEFAETPEAADRRSIPMGRVGPLCAQRSDLHRGAQGISARAKDQSYQRIKDGSLRSASVKAPAAGSDLSAHKSPSQESPSDTIPGVTSIGEVLLTMQAGRSIDQALAAEARSILEQVQLEIWATGKNLDGFTPVHARKLGEMLLAVGGSLDDVRKAAKRFINRKCRSGATAIGNPGGYWGKMLVGVCQTYNPHAQWPADAPPPGSEPRKSPR